MFLIYKKDTLYFVHIYHEMSVVHLQLCLWSVESAFLNCLMQFFIRPFNYVYFSSNWTVLPPSRCQWYKLEKHLSYLCKMWLAKQWNYFLKMMSLKGMSVYQAIDKCRFNTTSWTADLQLTFHENCTNQLIKSMVE